MKTPEHLKHKPIVIVDDYDIIDGVYAPISDTKALSIGLAQYSKSKNDISAKVWRNVNGKWSRQSEELPLHRVLDLGILLIGSFMKDDKVSSPITNLGEDISKNRNLQDIKDFYKNHKSILLPRIEELKRLIDLFLQTENDKLVSNRIWNWVWLHRFLHGLSPREEDIRYIKIHFPELVENPGNINKIVIEFDLEIPKFTSKQLSKSFKKWLNSERVQSFKSKKSDFIYQNECPSQYCPLKNKSLQTSPYDNAIHFMTIGGGPKSKTPKDSFLDLVRQVHKRQEIRVVILTDPYYLSDVSEDGDRGGWDNIIVYLKALNLSDSSHFKLLLNPSPKRFTVNLKKSFDKNLSKHFPNAEIATFSPQYKFHDRFYLVKDEKGILSGVFGPSMNGLNSDSIILCGQLEDKNTLDKLSKWF